MGMTNEKMYGSYSDADLNDWERFPMNAKVLTSSAFGAWLLRRDERRDERRDKAIPKADYENRLKADMVAMLTEIQLEIEDLYPEHQCTGELTGFADAIETIIPIIQQKINALKAESEDNNGSNI